ncbi:hypothetical protein EDC04DRAFT_458805 [Pisolithus marmoratus]|nr:hypothetical protein EDC04DRAFT_458805 [Pisolithus marmoratus]
MRAVGGHQSPTRRSVHSNSPLRPFHASLQASGYEYGIQKQIYARVSRWWRDVILNSPSLWATICVSPHWASSFVEMHVARSGEHPLDIAVLQRWHEDNDVSFLGPILSCTRRWRSLTIRAGAALTQFIRDLSGLYLPCLKSVNIQSYHDLDFEFPAADNTPTLERLVLKPLSTCSHAPSFPREADNPCAQGKDRSLETQTAIHSLAIAEIAYNRCRLSEHAIAGDRSPRSFSLRRQPS